MQNLKHRRTGNDLPEVVAPNSPSAGLPTTTLQGSTPKGVFRTRDTKWGIAMLAGVLCTLVVLTLLSQSSKLPFMTLNGSSSATPKPWVLVSYSYFEKDEIQKANMEFFLSVGFGYNSRFRAPSNTDLVIVINGPECLPCVNLLPIVTQVDPPIEDVVTAWAGDNIAMLKRRENEGMDFAAHNTTIEWLQRTGSYSKYAFFIFLNSSVKGPFVPHYMPPNWSWTDAYTGMFTESVGVVSSSLVCLPSVDAGGYGPKVESWAFALIPETLSLLTSAGVFNVRTCKLCDDGVVVMGEYGISSVLMQNGWNLNTLMYKYRDVNWLDMRHWNCNSNAHPSRHGTYDGVSMNPLEVVYIKASWHVGEPFTSKYSEWLSAQAEGKPTTLGTFDEKLYHYAITPEAQEPHGVERCYQVV